MRDTVRAKAGGSTAAPAVSTGSAAAAAAVSSTDFQLNEGDRIAVLVPLSGRFAASVGNPARLGGQAAIQDRRLKFRVSFYDTNNYSMAQITAACKQNGTKLILGPVLKPEVEALLSERTGIPTIAVNNVDAAPTANFWYFDLGPEYEGKIAAAKLAADGLRSPMIISATSTRSQRAAASFSRVWRQSGGQSPAQCHFTNTGDQAAALSSCSIASADSLYVSGSALEVQGVQDNLKPNVPMYLTDTSYAGFNSSAVEYTLRNAWIGDMPWLLQDSSLKAGFLENIPKADPQVQRIFAAFYDSVNLACNLSRLSGNSADVMHGLTGDVKPGSGGLIESAPMWV